MVSMDYSLQLRVSSVFIMFFVSLAGVVLPLYFGGSPEIQTDKGHREIANSDKFRVLRAFAAGIMLGVGFIHLLNDGVNKLTIVSLDYPPLGYTLATVGAMLVLGFEQIAVMLITRVELDKSRDSFTHNLEPNQGYQTGSSESTICTNSASEYEIAKFQGHNHAPVDEAGHNCDHAHAIKMIAETDSLSVIIRAYMMEISVAVHSIIIGIAIGSLSGPENVPSLLALIIAICFHQFFEGVGLGTVIEGARLQMGTAKVVTFSIIFAATVSIGISIGILVSTERAAGEGPSDTEMYVTGCLNSLAAGILIYVALVEMIAEDFQKASIAKKFMLKFLMFLSLTIGTLIMALLAIWA